jgi:quinoprotein glucose dehydrogenase
MLAMIPIALHHEPSEQKNISPFGHDLGQQRKAPYIVQRDRIVDHDGHSCTAPPWGVISAINLNTGTKVWEQPLGSLIPGQHTGITNFGGPIVTATGLVFTAAAEDPYLRAFDATSGNELWKYPLPVPAQATPMTYTLQGQQYIVIAAGGHGDKATKLGDSLIAFALEKVTAPDRTGR